MLDFFLTNDRSFAILILLRIDAVLAQQVERSHGKAEVAGSIPADSFSF